MKFKHLVFTNVGVGIFDTSWLLYRLEIFKNTLLPSLRSQSCKKFTWCVFIHENSPNIFKLILQDSLKDLPFAVNMVEVESYDTISKEINVIKDDVDADCLITSRIDDDDLIDEDVVASIRKIYTNKENESKDILISLEYGAEYLPREGMAMDNKYDSIALFLTLVTFGKKDDHWMSVNEYAHHTILKTLSESGADVKHEPLVTNAPSFLYVKHPLSDSFYSGARARILKNAHSYNLTVNDMARFGLSDDNCSYLKELLKDAPNGMPYKYMDKLTRLRNALKLENSQEKNKELLSKKDALEKKACRARAWAGGEERKIRLAILGSCVSRDLFEHEPQLKDKYEVSFYAARSSVISYMSPPSQDPSLDIPTDSFESKRAWYDLSKQHWHELEISRPDIILVDFVDERIGLIKHNGSYFTASAPMLKAFERARIEVDIMRPWSPEVVNLRRWAIDNFYKKLLSISDHVVLHKAAWATEHIVNGRVEGLHDSKWARQIELNNVILEEMLEYGENNFPLLDSIGGREIGMRAGGKHKWEFSPFHYDASYYKTLAKQLEYRFFL